MILTIFFFRIEFDTCAYISSEISEQDIIFYEEKYVI